MRNYLKIIISILCFLWASSQLRAQSAHSPYQFRETTELITYVQSAADLFSRKGKEAYDDFSEKGSKWFKGSRYLFIYDLNGVCVFHPLNPELRGQNLIGLQDMNGKPVIQYIVNIASRKGNPQGWVHYLWAESGEIFPCWKSAFVMRVEGPDGIPYAIGSGIYDMRIESEFMIELVDSAANLIESIGEKAFESFIDKKSVFYFADIYLFVISTDGKALVDPAFPGLKGRDLINFKDGAGRLVVQEMLEKLKTADKVFQVYLWPRPGQSKLSKKILYAKKVIYHGKPMIVGSGIFQTNPIWNKF